ncbi:Protocadherin alpha 4 unspliced [Phytophthora cinnamomi]|uniref:Protocadherin alpha 4 unspliced n=1 Tax=Phytophthora cinnamomi TaxID=4785 RepID=UPI003559E5C0|nr:Protocadherin alpha 4 unspliced [Phytophthora cinnamomi]
MKTLSGLLLLALATMSCYADSSASCSGPSNGPPGAISIGTVVSISDGQDQEDNATSSFVGKGDLSSEHDEPIDFVLVANMSISSSWIDGVAGYATAAESTVLYQAASWSLLEEGTQSGKFESYWARFQAVNRTLNSSVRLSVCAMVAEWNSSWPDSKSALSAVDMEDRMAAKCGENDTFAVAFTSSVSKTAASYLKGEIAVNGVVAALKMHDESSSMVPEAADRTFILLADGLCPRDESTRTFSSLNATGAPMISLMRGEACSPGPGSQFGPPRISRQGNAYESDWKHNLRFIIPVVVCVLLLVCAGFVYVRRQKKDQSSPRSEAPKEETPEEEKGEKEETSSQPYVLTTQPVVNGHL